MSKCNYLDTHGSGPNYFAEGHAHGPGLHIRARVTIMHVMATVPLVGGADSAGGTLEQRARCAGLQCSNFSFQFFSF